MAKRIMLVGTSSDVGKSILCTALCRIFSQDGYHPAPFKAQNMSLNSAVTPSGREIGRAQAVQAEAAGILPNEHMNPILLKPTGHMRSQVIVQGIVKETVSAHEYFTSQKEVLWDAVLDSYRYLNDHFDMIVIEGAGSPVEMNLKKRDIVNMRVAIMADACVILVADIDRGGVFASVVGTLALLTEPERRTVKGIVINRFRGDLALFEEGSRLLAEYAGIPVLGIIPYIPDLQIDEEDSLGLASPRYQKPNATRDDAKCLRIAIVQHPHMANFTDVDPLFLEQDVHPYFTDDSLDLAGVDAIILPGTKNTMEDLTWLFAQGLASTILQAIARGVTILGICGGFQMLGRIIRDPEHHESPLNEQAGLGVFACVTTLEAEKKTICVHGRLNDPFSGILVRGYEIHMGRTQAEDGLTSFGSMMDESGNWDNDGAMIHDGDIIGTYLHGILHNDDFRLHWLNRLRMKRNLPTHDRTQSLATLRHDELDRLAAVVRANLDMDAVYQLLDSQ